MSPFLVSLRIENGGIYYSQMTLSQITSYIISEAPDTVEVVRYFVRKSGAKRCTIRFEHRADRDNGYRELQTHVLRELRKIGIR